MRKDNVTYSEVQCDPSSQLQRTPAVSETKGTGSFEHPGYSAGSSPWKLISVAVLIICLVLLVSVGILATKLTEGHSGNITSSQETDQKGLISENLKVQSLPTNAQVQKCHPCEDNWYQHGENCYSFSKHTTPWRDCAFPCSTSSFLRLDSEKEMDLVKTLSKMQCYTHLEIFWINLCYNRSQEKWVWLDGFVLTLAEFQLERPDTAYDTCKYIKNGQLYDGNCKNHGYCICKKTIYGD